MTTQANGNSQMVQGRILWTTGKSLFEGKAKTDYNTGVPVLDVAGQPKIEYGFGLAVPKGTEEFNTLWAAMYAEAYTIYPSGQLPPDFAMKFKDGDGIDDKGKPFADREGYAGHIVIACTTMIPIKYFIHDGANSILVNDGIKTGDYVNVQLTIKGHPAVGRGKAGLYMNPNACQLIQAGKAIVNTPSGDQIFANAPMAYAGQVVADTAPAMPQMGQVPAMAPQMPVAQQAPAMPQMPVQQQAPVAPAQAPAHYGVVPQNLQPQAPVQAPPMGNAPVAPAMQAPQMPTSAPTVPSSNPMAPPMPGNFTSDNIPY